jgi:hypothetical protein
MRPATGRLRAKARRLPHDLPPLGWQDVDNVNDCQDTSQAAARNCTCPGATERQKPLV